MSDKPKLWKKQQRAIRPHRSILVGMLTVEPMTKSILFEGIYPPPGARITSKSGRQYVMSTTGAIVRAENSNRYV